MTNDDKDAISRRLGVEPILIDSALVSPQVRKRWYWTNIPGVEQPEDRGLIFADVILDYERVKRLEHTAAAVEYMYGTGTEGRTRWDMNYHSDTVNDKSATLVKSLDKWAPHNVVVDRMNGIIRKYHVHELEALQGLPIGWTEVISYTAAVAAIGNGWECNTIAHILSYIND